MAPPDIPFELNRPLSDQEIIDLVSKRIPRWKVACDNSEAEMVVLQQSAFRSTPEDLFLMSVAIKYAGIAKKSVTIAP